MSRRPAPGRAPELPLNTSVVAIGVLLVAGIAFARVSLSAQITRCGYRLSALQAQHLALLDDNRRLKVEVGQKQSVVRLLLDMGGSAESYVRADEDRVLTVRADYGIAPAAPKDTAAGIARDVAGLTAQAVASVEAMGQRQGAPTAVASGGKAQR